MCDEASVMSFCIHKVYTQLLENLQFDLLYFCHHKSILFENIFAYISSQKWKVVFWFQLKNLQRQTNQI